MSGSKNSVAKCISDIEPRALFTHCYGHALNLAASDTVKKLKIVKDALNLTQEIAKLIKYSSRREGIFKSIKEARLDDTSGIRVLCPTRWTVRADALASITNNFKALMLTWEETAKVVKDTDTKCRIYGVSKIMNSFDYIIFGNILGEMLLKHSDNLSSTLQHKSLSAAEGQKIAHMTLEVIKRLRNEESFDLFWMKVEKFSEENGIEKPSLPRRRKCPMRFDDGESEDHFHSEIKSFYRQSYYEAVDLLISCIEDRFQQPGYEKYKRLESLLLKACTSVDTEEEVAEICQFYKDDFNHSILQTQLQVFHTHFSSTQTDNHPQKIDIFDIKKYFLSLSAGQLSHMSQVYGLLQLILVMPATNASSERSFSALRRIKMYLRSTMKQERLNYLMLLHIHKTRTDEIDLKCIVNEFIDESEHRSTTFSKF